jgi:hypothetical protein
VQEIIGGGPTFCFVCFFKMHCLLLNYSFQRAACSVLSGCSEWGVAGRSVSRVSLTSHQATRNSQVARSPLFLLSRRLWWTVPVFVFRCKAMQPRQPAAALLGGFGWGVCSVYIIGGGRVAYLQLLIRT